MANKVFKEKAEKKTLEFEIPQLLTRKPAHCVLKSNDKSAVLLGLLLCVCTAQIQF